MTTTHDHFSHHRSIQFATEKAGATWRRVPLYDQPERASTPEILERLLKAIRPRTRAVDVTWVHSSTGVRLPIRAMADVVREVNRPGVYLARLTVGPRHEAVRWVLEFDGVR